MSEGTQRRLAAIISADVVGYSRLMGEDAAGTLAALRMVRSELFAPTVDAHHGSIVKSMGDGWLVEFASVVDAVTCGIEMQERLAGHETIKLRIGVHLGDISHEDEDIYGDGVNIAARLQEIAEPGAVVISDMARRSIDGKLSAAFADLGAQTLKNIAEPVTAYGWGMTAAADKGSVLPLPDKPSIAVLPFANMSDDPEQEYFSDGLTEDIITDLSKVSGLFVIARNSSFAYRGRDLDLRQICDELGVRHVLEGSVRKAGGRVRINAQLIDGTTGGHLWAERYDRDLADIFAVQDEVTQEIVAALKVTLSETEKSLIVGGGTRDVEAHDHFLKGRALMFGSKRDREMFEQSMTCFRRAIELDPNYAGAYAGLGMGYALDHQNHWSDAPESSLDKARSLVDVAIAKDDKDPFAHYVSAVVATWMKDYERWAYEDDLALSLNPNFAFALSNQGTLHIYLGEPAKAIPYIERAMRLDPTSQHGQYVHFLGVAYFVAGDYETAVACFKDRIAINPTTDLSRAFLASALGHLQNLDEAGRIWRELKAINPDYSSSEHIGRLPFRDPVHAEKIVDGLRKAGLTK